VEPNYTAEARAAGLQGTVSLYVEAGNDGKPSEVQVMEGLGLGLDEAAIQAVKQWEFRPSSEGAFEVDVPFRLDPLHPWFVESETYSYTPPPRSPGAEFIRPVPARYAPPDVAACPEAGGTVAVRFDISKDGKPSDVRSAQPPTDPLADAALKAVESWHFQPGEYNGKKVASRGAAVLTCHPGGFVPLDPGPHHPPAGPVTAPVLISKVEPEYSELARRSKVEGTVMLYIQITPQGKATSVHVVKMLGMGLDQKAIEAVKQWRFKPGMKGSQAVTVEATVEVNFRLL
jgi:TonB family protein